MCDVTRDTPVRKLRFSALRALSDLLDPQQTWRSVATEIRGASGEPRYSQQHIRRFEAVVLQGKSPTMELLFDWGTTDCSVGDLVEILLRHQLLAAVSVLLPDHSPCPVSAGSSSSSVSTLKCEAVLRPSEACLQACIRPKVTKPVSRAVVMEPDSSSVPEENTWSDTEAGFYTFTHRELTVITSGWDERPLKDGGCLLGTGGFGIVFRGSMGGTEVAVKKLNPLDGSSFEELKTQFNQEIQTLRSLKHENLVSMVGFSSDGEHLCLVYEFMPGGSLLERLACADGASTLSWLSRCCISAGAARGLQYLHQNNHIHRDVKSGNILLDEELVPKISDFGLTRASANHTCSTVMTGRIVGTTAYMAPEALRGEITPKSDVFSFGVVLLEILSGLPPVDEGRDPKLLMEMKDEIDDEELSLEDFIDGKMQGWQMEEVERMYDVASQCLCEKKNKRPTITEVLSELEDLHHKHSQSSR
ncbi:interleukin-1 receptor-associated kinase 4 isoform X5 [Carassius auratus]|uniref:Interleukin-1 receptor-associated kinase 4 n=1 Tax=Carassius auratus TaxID=7957 RepID=A0A6P6JE31_CARAU|nr:interleukin-1 receptor-associated kinase 4-like isoform X4 [Carassius auratus]XP_026057834.1 interleukin-1 receptor-associated kinase 4-like isoform X5 [Carassius auratus]